MALYVELDGATKPRLKPCLVRHLPANVLREICMMLDQPLHNKDYRALAGKLGYSWYEVRNLDRKPEPTATLLEQWWSDKEQCTVSNLIELLRSIKRNDVIEELEGYEFTVAHPTPVSSSYSLSAKEPTENDLVQTLSSQRFSSDDRQSQVQGLSSFAQRLTLTDASSSCGGPCSPSLEYDYDSDEELDRKVALQNDRPAASESTQQNSTLHYAQLHANYHYQHVMQNSFPGPSLDRPTRPAEAQPAFTGKVHHPWASEPSLERPSRPAEAQPAFIKGHHPWASGPSLERPSRPAEDSFPGPSLERRTRPAEAQPAFTGQGHHPWASGSFSLPSLERPTRPAEGSFSLPSLERPTRPAEGSFPGRSLDRPCRPAEAFSPPEAAMAPSMAPSLDANFGNFGAAGGGASISSSSNSVGPSSVLASDKVALVIGNRYYSRMSDSSSLLYPHRDAYDITSALQDLDFKVLSLVDVTLTEMRTAMLAFCKLLGEDVYAVFYFAGHGFEENGKNYLMPVDASADKNPNDCLAAQELLLEMRLSNTALNLLILDTCRVRPQSNVATSIRECYLRRNNFGNTIIAYSCSSQERAWENAHQENGVYATELLKHIRSNRRIEHILMDINGAVNGNPYVVQRPVFESDAIRDCRLTCPIDVEKCRRLFTQNRSHSWWMAMSPPESMECEKPDEGVNILLKFIRLYSNVLEIHVFFLNKNQFRIQELSIDMLMTSELTKIQRVVTGDVPDDGCHHKVCEFRIFGLQKLRDCLLCALQVQFKLLREYVLLDVKCNLAYPLISGYLKEFEDWVGAGK